MTALDSGVVAKMRAILANPSAAPDQRIAACENLIAYGLIDEIEDRLKSYQDDPTFSGPARKTLAMCRYLRTSGIVDDLTQWRLEQQAGPQSSWSDTAGEVSRLLYRAEGATRLILVFTGTAERFWLSIDLLHQFLRRQGHHLLYLRDPAQLAYLGGIADFGTDLVSTFVGIRSLMAKLRARHVSCLGSSLGGYGALRYGLALGADRVLTFNPITDLTWNGPWEMQSQLVDGIRQRLPRLAMDLGALYRWHPSPPPVTLYYGTLNRQDNEQAQRFRAVSNAQLLAIEGHAAHAVIPALLAQGQFGDILSNFAPAAATAP